MAIDKHDPSLTDSPLAELRAKLGIEFEEENAKRQLERWRGLSDAERAEDLRECLLLAEAIEAGKESQRMTNGEQRGFPEKPAEYLPQEIPAKIVKLHHVLAEHDIPYAIGGAIALGYYTEARGTSDIDVDIFLPPEEHAQAIAAFKETFLPANEEVFTREIRDRGQGRTRWDKTRIDVFFSNTEYQQAMAERVRTVPFNGSEIVILSAEDVIITKALFDRSKDWLDIDGVCQTMAPELDVAYLKQWLGEDPSILSRVLGLVGNNLPASD